MGDEKANKKLAKVRVGLLILFLQFCICCMTLFTGSSRNLAVANLYRYLLTRVSSLPRNGSARSAMRHLAAFMREHK